MEKWNATVKSHSCFCLNELHHLELIKCFWASFWSVIFFRDFSFRLVNFEDFSFWLFLRISTYVPLVPEKGDCTSLNLRSMWKWTFWCLYEKCFFDPKNMFLSLRRIRAPTIRPSFNLQCQDFDSYTMNVFLTFVLYTHPRANYFFISRPLQSRGSVKLSSDSSSSTLVLLWSIFSEKASLFTNWLLIT